MDSSGAASTSLDENGLENEITELERRLTQLKARRAPHRRPPHAYSPPPFKILSSALNTPTHFLLLLSDSALPLGSFAFSSGLESYLAHQKLIFRQPSSFASFLPLSVSSYASTNLPFALAAHRDPSFSNLAGLDDALDAAIVCTVGRRASVAQGRALLSIWERSFAGALAEAGSSGTGSGGEGSEALRAFSALLKKTSSSSSSSMAGGASVADRHHHHHHHHHHQQQYHHHQQYYGIDSKNDEDSALLLLQEPPPVSAHLAPLFGAVCALAGLSLEQTAYVFLLGHVKALVSAAVRAGMFGPYQAQKTLASGEVQGLIAAMVEREWATPVEEAGQSVPVMDLWVGRHEVLYSRIFNS
ncbi:hypothetical protein VTH82DRAFT_5252 [Thermothelomyces myriococcoides]